MVLGFTGKMGVGKTTASNYILENRPEFVKINFKDALVEETKKNFASVLEKASAWYGVPQEDIFKVKPPIVRALLQCYGTEVRRGDDENYWVKKWTAKVAQALAEGKSVVTDDVRFKNEAFALAQVGGKLIRIVREDITNTGTHQSETEMDEIMEDETLQIAFGEQDKLFAAIGKFI